MHVEDQVSAFVQTPGHVFGLGRRRRSGLPEKEMAVGLEALRLDADVHAGEADFRVLLVEATERLRPVYKNVGVMNDLLVAGKNLDRFDEARRGDRDGDDEIA